MSALDKYDEVFVTEAPIDALTLVEMGYPNTIAMIGTGNYFVLSSAIRRVKAMSLAFNFDEAGFKASGKTFKFLWEKGFLKEEGENVSDFTRQFFRSVGTDAKDYNAWWTSQKK